MALRMQEQILSICLEWKISKFQEINQWNDRISSEYPFLRDQKLFLMVYLHKNSTYSFHVHFLKNITSRILINCKFSVIDRHGQEQCTVRRKLVLEDHSRWKLITRMNLVNARSDFLIEDTLTVRCILSADAGNNVFDGATQTSESLCLEVTSNKLLKTLSGDFQRLYKDQRDADFLLKTNDYNFPVHRAVLSSRSAYFAAMFRHETIENANGEAEIKDIETAILNTILHYIYSGKIYGITPDTAVSIFEAADKYLLLELREEALYYLLQNLTVGNICEAVLLANNHSDEAIENQVVSFIQNNMAEVLSSEKWKMFSDENSALALEYLSDACLAPKRAKYRDGSDIE